MKKILAEDSKTARKSKVENRSKNNKVSSHSSKSKSLFRKKDPLYRQPHPLEQPLTADLKEHIDDLSLAQKPAGAEPCFSLPLKYRDNRIVLMARDPWWVFTYWDIAESRIEQVMASISDSDKQGLRWILRVYDVTGISDFAGEGANAFFDVDINFSASNWYLEVNRPGSDLCIEIGLKNSAGKFFLVARSNVIKTPGFGISCEIDEEWVLPDDEYFKLLGVYDLGRSSFERKRKFEEIIKAQISSPLASWGGKNFSRQKSSPPTAVAP